MKVISRLLALFALLIISTQATAATHNFSQQMIACCTSTSISGSGISDGTDMTLTTYSSYFDSPLGDYTITEISIFNIATCGVVASQ